MFSRGNWRQRWASFHWNLPWLWCGKLLCQPPSLDSPPLLEGSLVKPSFAAPSLQMGSGGSKPEENMKRKKWTFYKFNVNSHHSWVFPVSVDMKFTHLFSCVILHNLLGWQYFSGSDGRCKTLQTKTDQGGRCLELMDQTRCTVLLYHTPAASISQWLSQCNKTWM